MHIIAISTPVCSHIFRSIEYRDKDKSANTLNDHDDPAFCSLWPHVCSLHRSIVCFYSYTIVFIWFIHSVQLEFEYFNGILLFLCFDYILSRWIWLSILNVTEMLWAKQFNGNSIEWVRLFDSHQTEREREWENHAFACACACAYHLHFVLFKQVCLHFVCNYPIYKRIKAKPNPNPKLSLKSQRQHRSFCCA